MYKIERLDIRDPKVKETYAGLTEEKYLSCLEGRNPENRKNTIEVAVGVTENSKPVGLALASVYKHQFLSDIHWLKMNSEFAEQLIQKLQQELVAEGCNATTFTYLEEDPNAALYERIFREDGWNPPTLFQIHFEFDAVAFHPPWLDKLPPLPPDFEVFSWNDLTPSERKQLMREESAAHFPEAVSPFGKDEAIIERASSLGLRHEGEVIGWEVTHRIDHDTIRYSALFIRKPYLHRGFAIRLLGECMWRHKAAGVPKAVFDYTVASADLTWTNFIQRKLAPYANRITHRMQVWKKLD